MQTSRDVRRSVARGWSRGAGPLLLAVLLAACGVSVHTDRAAVGGGPEQATAQARAHFQSTVVAAATAGALFAGSSAAPCDCESTGK